MNPAKLPPRLFYIRGIIRNRLQDKGFYYPGDDAVLELLGDAHEAGVETEDLENTAKSLKVKTWTDFRDRVIDAIEASQLQE
jgi:hypothetical protein